MRFSDRYKDPQSSDKRAGEQARARESEELKRGHSMMLTLVLNPSHQRDIYGSTAHGYCYTIVTSKT